MKGRRLPLVVLVLLMGGISAVFLSQDDLAPGGAPAAAAGGPLVNLAPHMRGLPDGPDGEITARAYVDATFEQIVGAPREPILEALGHADWGAQWAGLLAVPNYGPPDAALGAALGPLLSAEVPRVRRLAATAVAFVGEGYDALEPALAEAASDPDAGVRAAALATLARRSPRARELWLLFAKALEDGHGPARAAAAKGLARIELHETLGAAELDDVRTRLRAAMQDAQPDVRMYAVMALGRAGSRAAPDVPAIIALLADESTLVRGTASNALGDVGASALPGIRAALGGAIDPEQASSLLWALRLIGKPALPLLREVLTHTSPTLRVQAALKLWELDEPPEVTVEVLVAALEGTDVVAQRLAARGLGRMGTAGAGGKAALEGVRDHEDEVIRTAARAALARWGDAQDK